jgi:hypothetical protein
MAGTSTEEEDAADKWEWMQNSLFAVGGIYRPCGNGEYVYAGIAVSSFFDLSPVSQVRHSV